MPVEIPPRRYLYVAGLTVFLLILLAFQFGPSIFVQYSHRLPVSTNTDVVESKNYKASPKQTPTAIQSEVTTTASAITSSLPLSTSRPLSKTYDVETLTTTTTFASPSLLSDASALSSQHGEESIAVAASPSPSLSHGTLPLPPDYQRVPKESVECTKRYGLDYLQSMARSPVGYCKPGSASNLTCFRTQTDPKGRVDSFCVGGPALADDESSDFKLGCELRDLTEQEVAGGVPSLDQFPPYWYATGPHLIFNTYVRMEAAQVKEIKDVDAPRNYTFLVKREEKTTNLWHSLMEIFSLYMTLDVLRMAADPGTGKPFFREEDIERSQVLILDDHPEGPYYDQWSMFAKKPMVRMSNVTSLSSLNTENIILPLPGASNPMWQGDWDVHACEHSELVRTFSQRVLVFHTIDDTLESEDKPLTLTFVDRKEKRRLINKELYLKNLQLKYPKVEMNFVDFAAIPFLEQLKIVRQTDILAGVHGAGLTHGLFLRPGSALVEIVPPTLKHKGFRNLAKLVGLQYFSSHATAYPESKKNPDWQEEDVSIEEDRFMAMMKIAIKSMYNRGLHNEDVI